MNRLAAASDVIQHRERVQRSKASRAGVLLIGHGTREASGTAQFFQLGQRLAELLGPIPVESSLLEFQEPTIPQAWEVLMRRGVQRVHVAPLLLFAAGHAKQDIPSVIQQCQSRCTGVTSKQARPLSRHPSIIHAVVERLNDSLAKIASGPSRTAVVMVGRGSNDPCAAADMRVLTEVVRHHSGLANVETAFYAMAPPRVPDVIDALAGTGNFDGIVVHPHLLFDGRLFQAIGRQVKEASHRHPDIEFVRSDYLGPDPRVAHAIASRCELGVDQGLESA